MSELTLCNYCSLTEIRLRNRAKGKTVRIGKSKKEVMAGWVAVKVDGEEVAWFMELTDCCVC